MDSVSQFVLGASVCAAALGSKAAGVRAALWGGVVATLPDLDILIEHGDAIQNMTRHRADSHSLIWLTLVAPVLAYGIAALHRERHLFRGWWWGIWLALFTHALLDALTIYGTQLLQPFSDHPFAVASLFVVDPLYTLPLLIGMLAVLIGRGRARSLRWNAAGLVLSTLYAAWSLVAQQIVTTVAEDSLQRSGLEVEQLVVSPAPFQTLLWRVIAVTPTRAYEGTYSLFDAEPDIRFGAVDRGTQLLAVLRGSEAVDRLHWFSGDFVKAQRVGDDVRMADLRMGAEPDYVFTFVVGRFDQAGVLRPVAHPVRLPFEFDSERGLPWLWRRMWGEHVPAPR